MSDSGRVVRLGDGRRKEHMMDRTCRLVIVALMAAMAGRAENVLSGDGTVTNGIGIAQQLATNSSVTIEAWVKIPSSSRSKENIIWGAYYDNSAGRADMFVKNGVISFFMAAKGTGTTNELLTATEVCPCDVWTHVAFTRDADTHLYAFYVNGAPAGSGTTSGSQWMARNMTVGSCRSYLGETQHTLFAGSIADVRIWTVARTAQEIASCKDTRLTGGESGLAAYLPLDAVNGNLTAERVTGESLLLADEWTLEADATLSLAVTNAAPRRGWILNPCTRSSGGWSNSDKTRLETDVTLTGRTFTVEGWICLPYKVGRLNPIAYQYASGGTGRFSIEVKQNTLALTCWFNGKSCVSSELTLGEWTHFAFVRNGTSATWYLNGRADASVTDFSDVDILNLPLTFFNLPHNLGAPASLLLHEVRAWQRALTQSEIVSNMYSYATGSEDDLAGCWRFTESTGTNILNRVTGVHSAIAGVKPAWAIGKIPTLSKSPLTETAPAASMTGSFYTLGRTGTRVTSRDFTLEAWVHPHMIRTTALHSSEHQVLRQYLSSDAGRFILCVLDGQAAFLYGNSGWVGGGCVPCDEWSHLAVSKCGSVASIYVNGEKVAENTGCGDAEPSAADITLGEAKNTNFDGAVREMRVWSVALDQETIRKRMSKWLRGNEANLVGCWHLDGKDGTKMKNAARRGVDGTLVAGWSDVEVPPLDGENPPEGVTILIR